MSLLDPDVTTLHGTLERCFRVGLALGHLGYGRHPAADGVARWLQRMAQADATDGVEPGELRFEVRADLSRVTVHALGAAPIFAPRLGTVLRELGASPAALATFERLSASPGRPQVGAWITLTPDGVDAGWSLQHPISLAEARSLSSDAHDAERLGQWAFEAGIKECLELRRSIAAGRPSCRLVLDAPEGAAPGAQQLALGAFGALALPPLPDVLAGLLTRGTTTPVATQVELADARGPEVGLVAWQPSRHAVDALAGGLGLPVQARLAELQDILAADAPERLELKSGRTGAALDVVWAA